MHFLKKRIWVCVSLLFLLHGCAMAGESRPLCETEVKVIKDKIYLNDKLFAELRYFVDKQYNIQRGIVIYYYHKNKEVWIYPKEGWSVRLGNTEYFGVHDISMIWNNYLVERQKWIAGKRNKLEPDEIVALRLGGKNLPKLQPTVFDIAISKKGKYIFYKTPGAFSNSSHKYLIEYK